MNEGFFSAPVSQLLRALISYDQHDVMEWWWMQRGLDWARMPPMRAGFGFGRDRLGAGFWALTVLGPRRGPAGEKKRRGDPSCCLEAVSCSYTHFTRVGMGALEGSPAFHGHPQGLCGTAHRPRGGGGVREGRG